MSTSNVNDLPVSRATVRVWLPHDLVTAVGERAGADRINEYVVAAVEKRLRLDSLDELLAELDAEHGPIPPAIRAQTARMWPDYDEDQRRA